ncbi:hypothetical protein ACFRFL_45170 [Streptomyces sp. NPDC056708]|uniref:hypothetical protein n=1 Tax=unclassified Streptomyces TaxID=2593676 RepID=UPI0036C00DA0
MEMLLAAVVHAEHDTDQEIRAAAEAGVPDAEADVEERLARLSACRLPAYEAALLLVALLRTAYPAPHHPGEGPAHLLLPVIRTVLAALLQADVQRTDPAVRHAAVFHRDLDEVALEHSEAFFGPLLARAVLDLTAADACAGVPLAERTEALVRHVGKADGRLLAAHLQHLLPDAALPGALDANAWWEQATGLLPALLAHRPTPEGARLADHLRSTCPPGTTAHLHTQMTAAFGAPPGPEDLAGYDPASAARPPWVWIRVWHWSPVPARTTPRPLGAGVDPAAPRQAVRPGQPVRCWPPRRDHQPAATRPQRNTGAGHIAAEHGPAATAAALAAAPDPRYLMVLRTLIETDPAAWTTAPADITACLALPQLRAFYLVIAAEQTRRRDAFPGQALAEAVAEALAAHRDATFAAPVTDEDTHTDTDDDTPTARLAEQALLDLLIAAWRADSDLGENLPTALGHLYDLTAPLTTPSGGTPDDTPPGTLPADFVGTGPAGRAVHCLLEHARHHHRTTGAGLPTMLLNHLTTITEATGNQPRTAAALGPYLPLLHDLAPDWLQGHRAVLLSLPADNTLSAASAWLRWGPSHPPLLADLDRAELLNRLRTCAPPEAVSHIAAALLGDPRFLGDPATLFAELAAAEGGTAAASRLLELLAHRAARAATAPSPRPR